MASSTYCLVHKMNSCVFRLYDTVVLLHYVHAIFFLIFFFFFMALRRMLKKYIYIEGPCVDANHCLPLYSLCSYRSNCFPPPPPPPPQQFSVAKAIIKTIKNSKGRVGWKRKRKKKKNRKIRNVPQQPCEPAVLS